MNVSTDLNLRKHQKLFFFTIGFPSSESEPFIKHEFPYLIQEFDEIIIIASIKGKNIYNTYQKTTVYYLEDILKKKSKFFFFISNFKHILQILYSEIKRCNSKLYFLKNIRYYNSLLINSFICAEFISKLNNFDANACFYSYWMNNHALTLSILKLKNKIRRFVFRVHGYDLILERWPHKYIVFQTTCHQFTDRIFTVSKKSLEYFKKNYSHNCKVATNYLASEDYGTNPPRPINDYKLTIVSCSNIIPLKRIHLIIEILSHVKREIEWFHFGDGFLKEDIEKRAKNLPNNIQFTLKGHVSQNELFDFYNNHHTSLFINVSDSEGLPFTIIEAASFGIPVIATDAGGTSEIVKNETGILLDINFNTLTVANLLNDFENQVYSTNEFRKGVKLFWEKNFYAGITYPNFIKTALLNQ